MICGWIEVEESKEDPIAQHSGGSKVPRNRIDDVSNHVRETFLLDPIKIVEVIQLKIAAFVQTVCVEKQGANAKNGNETQEIRTPANTPHLCNRTRCFQCFSFEVLCGGNGSVHLKELSRGCRRQNAKRPFLDLESVRQSFTLKTARAFAPERFAFWIQAAVSNAPFRSAKRIENCDACTPASRRLQRLVRLQ